MTRTQLTRLEGLAHEIGDLGKRIRSQAEPSQETNDLWREVREARAADYACGDEVRALQAAIQHARDARALLKAESQQAQSQQGKRAMQGVWSEIQQAA